MYIDATALYIVMSIFLFYCQVPVFDMESNIWSEVDTVPDNQYGKITVILN